MRTWENRNIEFTASFGRLKFRSYNAILCRVTVLTLSTLVCLSFASDFRPPIAAKVTPGFCTGMFAHLSGAFTALCAQRGLKKLPVTRYNYACQVHATCGSLFVGHCCFYMFSVLCGKLTRRQATTRLRSCCYTAAILYF